MEEERVTLSAAEQRRVLVLNHLEKGAETVVEAAQLVGVSVRQMKRLRAGYRREGASALAHGNWGKRPANAVEVGLARRVVELATTTYQGFNQQHLTEMLAEREGLHRRLVEQIGQSAMPCAVAFEAASCICSILWPSCRSDGGSIQLSRQQEVIRGC